MNKSILYNFFMSKDKNLKFPKGICVKCGNEIKDKRRKYCEECNEFEV